MYPSHPLARLATVVLLTLATLLPGSPAQAETRVMPGSFTGYAFDTCWAPSQADMDAWLVSSPYWGVGIYIAGVNRFCQPQTTLTPEWVQTQSDNGWRLLPITLGLQASCSTRPRYQGHLIDPNPADGYAAARAQGRAEARGSVSAAQDLGIPTFSTLWYDLENFNLGNTACRESALAFVSGWTWKLHDLGYASGFYSSGSSGIRAVDDARVLTPGRYNLPDFIWIGDWNGDASVESTYVRPDGWMPHARVHQYAGGHDETHGGVTINVDNNFMDVGRGSVPPAEPSHCGGVTLNFPTYRRLERGDRGAQVKAAQCILRGMRLFSGDLGFFYGPRTEQAVRAYQARRSIPADGVLTRRTWTALLSEGATPLLKFGSADHAVRRLQRSLNAAIGAELPITGLFDADTTSAVRAYQSERALAQTGVAAADTWAELRAGHR